jgi:hypothetical protein
MVKGVFERERYRQMREGERERSDGKRRRRDGEQADVCRGIQW